MHSAVRRQPTKYPFILKLKSWFTTYTPLNVAENPEVVVYDEEDNFICSATEVYKACGDRGIAIRYQGVLRKQADLLLAVIEYDQCDPYFMWIRRWTQWILNQVVNAFYLVSVLNVMSNLQFIADVVYDYNGCSWIVNWPSLTCICASRIRDMPHLIMQDLHIHVFVILTSVYLFFRAVLWKHLEKIYRGELKRCVTRNYGIKVKGKI